MKELINNKSLIGSSFQSPLLENEFKKNGYIVLKNQISESDLNDLALFWIKNKELYLSKYFKSTIELADIPHRVNANALFKKVTENFVEDLLINYEQYYGGFGVKFSVGESSSLDAHQDTTMVPYEGSRTGLTIWFSLIDVDERNGCLYVIPQSHLYNRRPRSVRGPFQYKKYREEIERFFIPLRAKRGQLIIMDQSLIHKSSHNTSENVRVAAIGMLKPKEDHLVYYNRLQSDNANDPVELEVFEVPDNYYVENLLTERPKTGILIGKIVEPDNAPNLWF